VTVEEKLWGAFGSVELEDLNIAGLLACKVLAAVGELDLTTVFDGLNGLIVEHLVVKNVHHFNALLETSHNVESRGVQSERVSLFREGLLKFKLELIVIIVGPNSDRAIVRAGRNELLLYANVQPMNLLAVETSDEVVIGERFISWLIKVDFD
jgi:hypothetical protein